LPGNHVRDVPVGPSEAGVALNPRCTYDQDLAASGVYARVFEQIQLCCL
jgi:hypothetical protein